MKTCNKCLRSLDLDKFVKSKACKDGRAGTCKDCQNCYSREWKNKNQERIAPIRRQQYAERYGQIQRQKEKERKDLYPIRVRAQLLRSGMLQRSRKGIPFDRDIMTVPYIIKWIKSTPNCPCCGRIIDYNFKHDNKPNASSPSIDRIYPDKGYVVGNVAIICWRCNVLKRDSSPDELQRIVNWIRSVEI